MESTEIITRPFISATEKHTLTSSYGYVYGKCPRQLYYANRDKKIGYAPEEIEMMEWGKQNHSVVEEFLILNFPEHNFRKEQYYEREIIPVNGIRYIGATYDLVSRDIVIEIKPLYSVKAYIQMKIEAFVNPTKKFFVFQYLDIGLKKYSRNLLIPIQAGTKMDAVYVGRIITALKYKPPRFPFAHINHKVCKSCLFRSECYSEPEITWSTFRILSKKYVNELTAQHQTQLTNQSRM